MSTDVVVVKNSRNRQLDITYSTINEFKKSKDVNLNSIPSIDDTAKVINIFKKVVNKKYK